MCKTSRPDGNGYISIKTFHNPSSQGSSVPSILQSYYFFEMQTHIYKMEKKEDKTHGRTEKKIIFVQIEINCDVY